MIGVNLDTVCAISYLSVEYVRPPPDQKASFDMTDINAFIDDKVKTTDVFLFMKGTPDFPQCGFSGQVVQILNYLGIDYDSANVLENDELREGIKAYSNWPTIPQLYVKGEFVGGADITREMFQSGELQGLLEGKGIAVRQTA
ncbi:glutaredoxin [Devosia nitrariae]|uniref:Glutaredoxin n=2 Tax=Devosia nitrariae TaxID=2071872 RepID=A0ABQ5WC70_9HYPH|nr:glutaredoxin [Devosia nitrariae]